MSLRAAMMRICHWSATYDRSSLEHLKRRRLPEGEHPKTWPAWGIARADRREVVLESLYQYYLYAGICLAACITLARNWR